jgi:hypothetical protein
MLLKDLIQQGNHVFLEAGKLVVVTPSGEPASDNWLKENSGQLIAEILTVTDTHGYRFIYHTTGMNPNHREGRVTLWFANITTEQNAVIHFTAKVTRSRNGKGKSGEKLINKKFTPPKHGSFTKFINGLGIEKPRSLSEWRRKLPLLKNQVFAGDIAIGHNQQDKFYKKIIYPVNVSEGQIKQALTSTDLAGNARVTRGEAEDNARLRGGEAEGKHGGEGNGSSLHGQWATDESDRTSKTPHIKNNPYPVKSSVYPIPPSNSNDILNKIVDRKKRQKIIQARNQPPNEWIDDYSTSDPLLDDKTNDFINELDYP